MTQQQEQDLGQALQCFEHHRDTCACDVTCKNMFKHNHQAATSRVLLPQKPQSTHSPRVSCSVFLFNTSTCT